MFLKKIVLIAAFSLVVPAQAGQESSQGGHAYEPAARASGSAMLVDIVIARPLGLLATVVGAAAWVVSLPFSLPSGSADEAAQALIAAPVAYTFKRPLGEIPDCRFEDSYGERDFGERVC